MVLDHAGVSLEQQPQAATPMIPKDDIDNQALAAATPAHQRRTMLQWFRERFEDPAERTPYDSEEGGYIWIWGGPHEAGDVLQDRFHGVVPEQIIDDLAAELSDESWEWVPTPQPGDYDEGLFEAISANTASRATLNLALQTIRDLAAVPIESRLEAAFRRLLFANAITVLETFLSDAFINRVLASDDLLQRYIDSDPTFRNRKISYSDVLREASEVAATAKAELLDIVWHNVGKVKALYKSVLGIDLGDMTTLASAIQIRHDIVHRNGRTKDGAVVEVTAGILSDLIDEVERFAGIVEKALDSLTPEDGAEF